MVTDLVLQMEYDRMQDTLKLFLFVYAYGVYLKGNATQFKVVCTGNCIGVVVESAV